MKYTLNEIIDWETKNGLWDIRFKNVPIWMYLRDNFVSTTRAVPSKHKIPSVFNVIGSFIALIKLHVSSKKYTSLAFLCNRRDVTDFWRHLTLNKNEACVLFLHLEVAPSDEDKRFSTCDCLNVLRILVRKVAWLIYYSEYKKIEADLLQKLGNNKDINNAIKLTIGEAIYNKILPIILPKNKTIYYSGAGIPATERFMGMLNCYEIQHGVIHTLHPGYIGWPPVKTGLIVYAPQYKTLLKAQAFANGISCIRFKSVHKPSQKPVKYPVVIYSQPLQEVSEFIERVVNDSRVRDIVYLKLHPRDYYDYKVEAGKIIGDHHPTEVHVPVMYTTSIAEDFIVQNKQVVIFDVVVEGIDIQAYLTMYDVNPDCPVKLINDYESFIEYILIAD